MLFFKSLYLLVKEEKGEYDVGLRREEGKEDMVLFLMSLTGWRREMACNSMTSRLLVQWKWLSSCLMFV